MNIVRKKLSEKEFISLAAMLISLVALSIDSMLPALPNIANSFSMTSDNSQQLIITSVFLGLGIGQFFYGPLSDAIGRRPAISLGMLIFFLGCILCIFSTNFTQLLCGRFLQGLGAASPRIVTMAMVRDCFEGVTMARILSFIMAIFILVPALAPLAGQVLLLMGDWPFIFVAIFLFGLVSFIWFWLRQPETLEVENRTPFRPFQLWQSLIFISKQKTSLGATLVLGFLFGGFVAYLSSAQQIFVGHYQTGHLFPMYFAGLALSIGMASVINTRLVVRFGIKTVCLGALITQTILAWFLVLLFHLGYHDEPPMWLFLLGAMPIFLCFGLQFGNLNSVALQPLGKIAGLGASLISSGSTLLAVPLGAIVGHAYNGTPFPLMFGFAVFGLMGSIIFYFLCNSNNNVRNAT